MNRRLRLLLAVVVTLAILGGALVGALPEVVRRVALVQIPKLTGRAMSLEDIDLNLFTGRVALKKFRLAEREPSETFVRFDRLDLRLSLWALWRRAIQFTDLTLTSPSVRIVRTSPAEFNFSDLLALIPPADPSKPKKWTVTIDRLAVVDGGLAVSDRAVSPAREWQVQGLGFEAGGLTTLSGQSPGHLLVHARVNGATLEVRGSGVRLSPSEFAAQISLEGFDLTQIRSYAPPEVPVTVERGTLGLNAKLSVERTDNGF